MQRRLEGLVEILCPTPSEIQVLHSRADRPRSLLAGLASHVDPSNMKSQLHEQRLTKLQTHYRRIATDIRLLFRFETDLDDLVQRMRLSTHSLARRSQQHSHKEAPSTQALSKVDDGLEMDDESRRDAVQEVVSRRDRPALQKRGNAVSSLWDDEQFEPTTTEPTAPFIPSWSQAQIRRSRENKYAHVDRNKEAFHQNHDLLNKLESEFDELVQTTAERGPELVRRSLSDLANHEQVPVHAGLGASHQVQLHPRSGGNSEGQPQSIWQGPSTEETMASLGLRDVDLGAEAIARFWNLRAPLFPSVPRSQETLQELKNVYSPYQSEHPLRAQRADITDASIFTAQVLESGGRDRFADIDEVLHHLVSNPTPLGLDAIRINYLRALKLRFDLANQLLTPTPSEIVRMGAAKIRRVPRGMSAVEEIWAIFKRIFQYLGVRSQLAQNNRARWKLDLTLLSHLEECLDLLVRGAETRMATGGARVFRRGISQETRDDALLQAEQDSDSRTHQPRPSKAGTLHRIKRGLIFPPSSPEIPATLSRPTQSTPTDGDWNEEEEEEETQPHRSVPRTIEQFLHRDEALLPTISQSPDQRAHLTNLFRTYQEKVPLHGEGLDLENAQSLTNLMMNDIGRDRFRHIQPLLAYLLEHRQALRLNKVRVRFLKTAAKRFRKVERMMSPTLDDFARQVRLASESRKSDEISNEAYQTILRSIYRGKVLRSNRVSIHSNDMVYDLKIIKRIETEFGDISGPIQRAGEAGSHLVRREVRLYARMDDEEEQPPVGPEPSSPWSVNRRQPTTVEMGQILSPIGMQLDDEYARPIAVWRLHESSLLFTRTIPSDLRLALRWQWDKYRRAFPHNAPINFDGMLSVQDGIAPYIDTDEGARFGRARRIIRVHYQLSSQETDYLNALEKRFEATAQLMDTFAGLLPRLVTANDPHALPVYRQRISNQTRTVRNWLIQAHSRQIDIDSKLLHAFEFELGDSIKGF
ncbi:uncharacterized protein SPSC_05330 [Sporisorium scitamineum]|uniref:Uncharacterized protein n=1 Tax=Sporisorium scitamineum TaxID=49012 RepID=A0A127ZIG8_9BASI|nr:uncharacterized protein SPSC_05330 [Sporisorium scitamineum]